MQQDKTEEGEVIHLFSFFIFLSLNIVNVNICDLQDD